MDPRFRHRCNKYRCFYTAIKMQPLASGCEKIPRFAMYVAHEEVEILSSLLAYRVGTCG